MSKFIDSFPDLCELLAQEGRHAELLQKIQNELSDKSDKEKIKKIRKVGVDKMKLLHAIVKNIL